MNYNKYLSLNFQYLGMDKSNIYTIRFQFLGPGCVPLYDEETRRVIIIYINLFQKQKVQKDSKNYAYNRGTRSNEKNYIS